MNNQYNWFKLLGLDDTLIICTLIFIISLILVRIIIKRLGAVDNLTLLRDNKLLLVIYCIGLGIIGYLIPISLYEYLNFMMKLRL